LFYIDIYIREIISSPGDGCRGYCNLQLKVEGSRKSP